MNKRLLALGLMAVLTQVFSTGCCLVSRWRANHPCGIHSHYHPLLHPIQTRRAAIAEGLAGGPAGPVSYGGPVVMNPPCHGCGGGVPGVPVSYGGAPGEFYVPTATAGTPTIGYPMPLTPGPTVVPSHELPNPMPLPKTGTGTGTGSGAH
jgi:hypothetical protein